MSSAAATHTLLPVQILLTLTLTTGCLLALTESEARTVCVAICLRTFRSQVSDRLASILASDPLSINRECGRSQPTVDRVDALLDRMAASMCQSCNYSCNHYSPSQHHEYRNCTSFCQVVSTTRGFDPVTCRRSCDTLTRLILGSGGLSADAAAYVPAAPQVKRAARSEGRRESSTVELDWSDYNVTAASTEPIVFLVQFRTWQQQQHQLQLDEELLPEAISRWNSLAITTSTDMLVVDLARTSWYQFRVAAVSPAGLRGYSEASEPLRLRDGRSRGRRPGKVRDLQEGISRLRDGAVDVQILWKPPRQRLRAGEQQIHAYEVTWVEMLGIEVESNASETQLISGTQTEYFVLGLKQATTYKVTVSTVVVHGANANQHLKSRRSIYVVTMQLPTSRPEGSIVRGNRNMHSSDSPTLTNQQRPMSQLEPANDCSCRDRPVTPLVTKQPYYENGELRLLLLWPSSIFESGPNAELVNTYTIRWSQRVCIESGAADYGTRQTVVHNTLMLNITGLKFNCHYALQFNGQTKSGKVAFTWSTCFCTASCKETKIKGNRIPLCPKTEGNSLPQPPDRLRVTQLTPTPSDAAASRPGGAVAVRLSWAAPPYPPLRAILGFRIRWGPRELEGVHPEAYTAGGLMPRMNEARAITRVVDMRERHHLLHELLEATVYIVSIQTLTVFGDSSPARTHFITPGPTAAVDSSATPEDAEVQKYIIHSGPGEGTEGRAPVASASQLFKMSPAPLILLAGMTQAASINYLCLH